VSIKRAALFSITSLAFLGRFLRICRPTSANIDVTQVATEKHIADTRPIREFENVFRGNVMHF